MVTYNERMGDGGENVVLVHDVVHLLQTNNLSLFEDLHCIEFIILLIPCKPYSPEGA